MLNCPHEDWLIHFMHRVIHIIHGDLSLITHNIPRLSWGYILKIKAILSLEGKATTDEL